MSDNGLHELDQKIIRELRHNGRATNTEIARKLGVSETTIRNRLRRLLGQGTIRVATLTNLSSLGYEVDVHILVNCQAGRALDIARELAAMEEVRYVSFVTGRCDLLVAAVFRTRNELFTFLNDCLSKIPGVERTETINILRVMKRDYDFWEPLPTT